MKQFIFYCIGIATYLPMQAQDTITVEIGTKSKVMIIAKDRKTLKKMSELDFNNIMRVAIQQIDTNANEEQTIAYIHEDTLAKIDSSQVAVRKNEDKTWKETRESGVSPKTLIEFGKDTYEKVKNEKWYAMHFYLGFNNYLEANGNIPTGEAPYGLRNQNSAFFGATITRYWRVGGRKSNFYVSTGILADVYSFRFREDIYVVKEEKQVAFRSYEADFPDRNWEKSKLKVGYVGIPLNLNLWFKDKRGDYSFRVGIGGYGAYQTDGRVKVNHSGNDKDRTKGDYFLNNWRYGIEATLGYGEIMLFVKYDLNTLYQDNRGPKLHPISFGIRI